MYCLDFWSNIIDGIDCLITIGSELTTININEPQVQSWIVPFRPFLSIDSFGKFLHLPTVYVPFVSITDDYILFSDQLSSRIVPHQLLGLDDFSDSRMMYSPVFVRSTRTRKNELISTVPDIPFIVFVQSVTGARRHEVRSRVRLAANFW